MKSSAILLGLLQCLVASAQSLTTSSSGAPFAPSPLPQSHATTDGDEIVRLFQTLGRTTTWNLIASIAFQGETYEPEGMVRLGPDRYFVSATQLTSPTVPYGKVINGTDRSAGAGFAHLLVFSGNGTRITDATLSQAGDIEYHNGGIDYDGQYVWATIAEYRPNSTARVVKIDPKTLAQETVLRYNDHLGGIVHDVQTNKIAALNWGARNASSWDLNKLPASKNGFTSPKKVVRNPTYFVDYQDCKFLGRSKYYAQRPVMLCSGVATIGSGLTSYNLGGVAIVDVETMIPLMEVPITMRSTLGTPVTQNPVEASVEDGRLRLYFLPDQHISTLYIYEAVPDSPFEYGGRQ